MDLKIDTHTHTVMSGHAFYTIYENLQFAVKKELQGIVVTEHSEKMPGTPRNAFLTMQRVFPNSYHGVRIFKGKEVNIDNYSGHVDVKDHLLQDADMIIASMHKVVITPASKAENTEAILGAIQNPYVDIIGHPGDPTYEKDLEAIVIEAKKYDKILEINNSSFIYRTGSFTSCRDIISLCKKYGVRVAVGSDAHICFDVGVFDHATQALEEEGYPYEMIVSRDLIAFEAFLRERRRRVADQGC